MCEGVGLCVLPVSEDKQRFDLGLMDGANVALATKGMSPQAAAPDRETRLLFVADGTGGLTVMDFRSPGGQIDRDGDGVDDRVVATISLESGGGSQAFEAPKNASARRIAFYQDGVGRRIAAVAAGERGLYLVQVGPADIELKRAWEVDNPANFIPNNRPYCEEADARVEAEALFLVEEAEQVGSDCDAGSHCFHFEVDLGPGIDPSTVLWRLEQDGTQVAPEGTEPGKMPADGSSQLVAFPARSPGDCFPNQSRIDVDVGDIEDCLRYDLRFGFDRNLNNQLDEEEWRPYGARNQRGVLVRPYVVGLNAERYENARGAIDGIVDGLIMRFADPFTSPLREARSLLRIFRDGNPAADPQPAFHPNLVGEASLSPGSEYADWLTHNAGFSVDAGETPEQWSTTILHATWNSESPQSELIVQSMTSPLGDAGVLLEEIQEIIRQHPDTILELRNLAPEKDSELSVDGPPIVLTDWLGNSKHPEPSPCAQEWDLPCQISSESGRSLYRVISFEKDTLCNVFEAIPFVGNDIAAGCADDLGDSDTRINPLLGRTRLTDLQIRLGLQKILVQTGGDLALPVVALYIEAEGQIDDLYDFSYAAPEPAPEAASLQLAHRDERPSRIYRTTFLFAAERTETFAEVEAWLAESRGCADAE